MKNKNTGFHIKTDALDEHKEEAEFLLAKRDYILDELAKNGMHEDAEYPYAYYIPTNLSFDVGKGKHFPLRAIYAVVLMARASYSTACFLDCDQEGMPELPQFCGGEEGFHRVYVTDPFAQHLEAAIRRYRERMVAAGKARIVNGRFFKVA